MAAAARMVAPHAALTVEGASGTTLVVADLHVGFEESMARGGVLIDSAGSAGEIASEIEEIIRSTRAGSLVLLGDTKSDTRRITPSEWREIPAMLGRLARAAEVIIVPGNHDSGIERLAVPGVSVSAPFGIVIDGVLLTHGHVMPPPSVSGVSRIVMGHAHPTYSEEGSLLRGHRVWASLVAPRRSLFASAPGSVEIIVMPSFNRYITASGARRQRAQTSPILARALRGVESARIVTLDGAIIGDESSLGLVL